MHVQPFKSAGLAHLSYMVHDGGRAAVIDPRLDIDAYLVYAHDNDLRITHIFETHRNEDLVSGARSLAARVGAAVHHGTALDFDYGEGAADGERFEVGDVVLTVIHTPGHTDESISIAVRDRGTGDDVLGVFTGDALFVDDVGRTDFYPDRAREVAGLLYDSLHERLLPLGDQALIWPAHGAGSVCGGGMADRDVSTMGYERANNDRLQLDRDVFIEAKLAERHDQPPYFRQMERINQQGHPGIHHLPQLTPVGPEGLDGQRVDVRSPESWAGCHIDGSLCLPASMLPSWAGWWLSYERPIALIGADPGELETALRHLTRLGYTDVRVSLRGGIAAWQTAGRPVSSAPCVSASELAEQLDQVTVLDVRNLDEWNSGHIAGALHIPLSELEGRRSEVPRDHRIVTVCGSGRRATIAASLLLARHDAHDVAICFGSMAAWHTKGLPVTE